MKIVKKYKVLGSNIAASFDANKLAAFAQKMGIENPEIAEIEVRYLETGDRVTISKCFGSVDNEDGPGSGGEWRDVTGVFEAASSEVGFLKDDAGNLIQSIARDMDRTGFPYANVRLT